MRRSRTGVSATSTRQLIVEEEAEIERLQARWLGLGLSTAPADRPAAERAIADLYRALGLEPPGRCVWAHSPLQGAAAATMAQFLSPWMPAQVRAAEWARDMDGAPGAVIDAIRQGMAGRGATDDWEPLREETWTPPRSGSPGEAVWGFTSSDWAPNRSGLGRRFGAEAGGRLGERLERMYWNLHAAQVYSVMRLLGDAIERQFWLFDSHFQAGQQDASRAAVAEYLGARLGVMTPARDAMIRLAGNCGWWWPYRGAVILSERPRRLGLDAGGRLHADDGPALEYPDGWGVYAWHGREVPERLILKPDTITVAEVLAEANIEIRRIMLERMGYARFILESGARPVHADDAGTLYRIELPGEWPLTLVHVTNATPEPDGSVRRYALRVPPRMRRAGQAVAWTFGMSERQYAPARET